jgi:iron complex transport system ATP-binding protein
MPQVLDFSDVVVRRNAKEIVSHLDWRVDDDQRWVVLGANGAGKTTVLQLAATLEHPTFGSVTILGERMGRTDVFELRPRIGFASSAMARRIPADETVLNVVLTAAFSVLGRWNEQYDRIDERRALRVLAEWKLDHLADRTFGTLSDGEQKRVQIARAVMTDPELLLLDEPTASLDLRHQLDVIETAKSCAARGVTVVAILHDLNLAGLLANRIVMLDGGRVAGDGTPAETITDAMLDRVFGVADAVGRVPPATTPFILPHAARKVGREGN